jgi:O-antigen/teichoic acid export membrane protein
VIISRQFGAADLGLYFLATKLAFLPNEISSKVVGTVAFPLYAHLQANAQRAAEIFRALFTGLWTALVPGFTLIIVLAPSLVDNVLGFRWQGTTTLIQLLAIVGLVGLIGDSTVPVLKGLGQPYKFAALEGAQSFILIISAWTLTQRFGLIGAALAWFPAIAGTLLVSIVFLKQILPRPFAGLEAPVVAIAVASGMGAFIALAIDNIIPGVIGLISASILAVVGIIVTLWFLDQRFNIGLFRNLAQAFPQVVDLVGITPANP